MSDSNEVLNRTFIDCAEKAAEESVHEWIRKTLREVMVQAVQSTLQQKMRAAQDLNFSESDLQACLMLVQRVASLWQDELLRQRNEVTSEWVQSVCETGKANLWEEPSQVAEVHVEVAPTETNMDSVGDIHHAHNELGHNFQPLIYGQMRRLGQRTLTNLSSPGLSPSAGIAILQAMGERGASYWPLPTTEWVDQAAQDIPQRIKGNNDGSKTSVSLQYQVVPSANPPTQGVQSASTTHDEILEAVVLRKQKNKRVRQRNDQSKKKAPSLLVGRPPSDITSARYWVMDELSRSEKLELDQLVHNGNDTEPPSHLFGALYAVGTFCSAAQKFSNRGHTSSTNKVQRASIRQRLAPRRVEKNRDPQRYRSKVLKTVEVEIEDDDMPLTYVDLDMGWTLLERTAIDGQKRLLAFSNIEVTLREE